MAIELSSVVHAPASSGRMFYVVGPAGAGKDTLLAYARERVPARAPIVFGHRYITRPVAIDGENHIALTDVEFARRDSYGCFAMNWRSHGYRYGVGVEIHQWLARGLDVVVSGSRGYLAEALARYPDLGLVWISADLRTLRKRLVARGREAAADVDARLERAVAYSMAAHPPDLEITNDGAIAAAGDRLLEFLLTDAGARRTYSA